MALNVHIVKDMPHNPLQHLGSKPPNQPEQTC